MRRAVLITGGAGFIGSNAAADFLQRGWKVLLVDNLSRRGADRNLSWLRAEAPARERLTFSSVDLREGRALRRAIDRWGRPAVVLHLAAQVAVTDSLRDPIQDVEVNVGGTLNLLELVRTRCPEAVFLFASSNKVYGALEDLPLRRRAEGWICPRLPRGIPESRAVDPYTPYGCSKASAEHYIRDAHRLYGIRTVIFRQSCIYGARQFGSEDQGWLAWMLRSALEGRPITVYGDGDQVRDVLYVSDLLEAYRCALRRIRRVSGAVFNVGGGPTRTISVRGFLRWMASRGVRAKVRHAPVRPGDQRYYVSDLSRISKALAWQPRVRLSDGLARFAEWIASPSP